MAISLADAVCSFLVASHPDIESLVRYRDGGLSPDRGKAIDKHLRTCQACRLEYQRLGDAFTSESNFAAPESGPDNDRRLAGLLAGIQDWEAAAANAGLRVEGIRRRVAGSVEKYLGTPATSKILQSVSGDGGNLLSTVEPVLAVFLGRKAASDLVSHVAEAAIVRI